MLYIKMSEWQNALDNYQNGINSVAQDNIQSLEGGAQTKIQDIQAQVGVTIGKASAQGMSLLGHDTQAAGLAQGALTTAALAGPTLWRGAQSLMRYRTAGMRSRATLARSEAPPDPEVQRQADLQERYDNLPDEQKAGVKQSLSEDDATYGNDGNIKAGVQAPSLKNSNDVAEKAIADGEAKVPGASADAASADAAAADPAASSAADAADAAASAANKAATGVAEGLEGGAQALESVTDFMSAAAPWLGGLGAAVGLAATIWETAKAGADAGSDPYKKIQGQVDAANAQTAQLTANISSDQFASKIGAAAPRYGSLAVPQMNTAVQPGVALHV
tara:strand:- start:1332 stop:2330 length:999 start_codon:yes stop_codon:yes gene_type:complete